MATPDSLRRMQPRLSQCVAQILPGERLDALCYSCTAASVVMGDAVVEVAVQEAKPDVPVITPAKAARIGLDRLKLRRISILTSPAGSGPPSCWPGRWSPAPASWPCPLREGM